MNCKVCKSPCVGTYRQNLNAGRSAWCWEYVKESKMADEEYEEFICPHCNGSGEGRFDGTTCRFCGGSGVEYLEKEPDNG